VNGNIDFKISERQIRPVVLNILLGRRKRTRNIKL
jgi:hypothetical protein